jgi:hypothetical protein
LKLKRFAVLLEPGEGNGGCPVRKEVQFRTDFQRTEPRLPVAQ